MTKEKRMKLTDLMAKTKEKRMKLTDLIAKLEAGIEQENFDQLISINKEIIALLKA